MRNKSKEKLTIYKKSKKAKRALLIGSRDYYRKKPEEKVSQSQLDFTKQISGSLKNQIKSSGIPQMIQSVKEQYISLVKPLVKESRYTYYVPTTKISSLSVNEDQLNKIVENTAQKIATKTGLKLKGQYEAILFLTNDGDLYRQPKEKYIYPMRNAKTRLKILRLLKYKYTDTETIQIETGSSSTYAVRKAIQQINERAMLLLRLEEKLIESKAYSGYKINPIYQIEHLEYE